LEYFYVWSKAQGSLNTLDNFLAIFLHLYASESYDTLPFDIPHRLLAYGEVKSPHGITVMPALEVRSGFPSRS